MIEVTMYPAETCKNFLCYTKSLFALLQKFVLICNKILTYINLRFVSENIKNLLKNFVLTLLVLMFIHFLFQKLNSVHYLTLLANQIYRIHANFTLRTLF